MIRNDMPPVKTPNESGESGLPVTTASRTTYEIEYSKRPPPKPKSRTPMRLSVLI